MKTIYAFRHSIANTDYGNDVNRSLTDEGIEYFSKLVNQNVKSLKDLQLVFVSSALRTKQTAEILLETIPDVKVEFVPSLYNSSKDYILKIINECSEEVDNFGVIAHNPGISDLVSYLVDERVRFQPGNFAKIEYNIDSWQEVSSGNYSDWSLFF